MYLKESWEGIAWGKSWLKEPLVENCPKPTKDRKTKRWKPLIRTNTKKTPWECGDGVFTLWSCLKNFSLRDVDHIYLCLIWLQCQAKVRFCHSLNLQNQWVPMDLPVESGEELLTGMQMTPKQLHYQSHSSMGDNFLIAAWMECPAQVSFHPIE